MLLISYLLTLVAGQSGSGRCTFHPYESDTVSNGDRMDNAPGWCGVRYSVLNVARITAVHGLDSSMCNQCLRVSGINGGPSVYVLAVDYKEDPGLDVAKSSFAAMFPHANPLDPQVCQWQVVEHSYCTGICLGTNAECTPGSRNLLPANQLPKMPKSPVGLGPNVNEPPTKPLPKSAIIPTTISKLSPKTTTSADITSITAATTETTTTARSQPTDDQMAGQRVDSSSHQLSVIYVLLFVIIYHLQ